MHYSIEMNDTIYALSSAPGVSGVAVIRVTGGQALFVAEKIILSHNYSWKTGKVYIRDFFHPKKLFRIDRGFFIFFQNPKSFTGQDLIEFQIHGSKIILDLFFEALESFSDVRLAQPGEFALRAFLNGKINLIEAEGLVDLIEAETFCEHEQASKCAFGETTNSLNMWYRELIALSALIESSIDFLDEEDVLDQFLENFDKKIYTLINNISALLEQSRFSEKIKSGIKVVLLGAPNVGKSSIFNSLLQSDRSIVSPMSGTTRDIIEAVIQLDGIKVNIYDTAGICEFIKVADNTGIEYEGIKRAINLAKDADIRIFVNSPDIRNFTSMHLFNKKTDIILWNKIDLIKQSLIWKSFKKDANHAFTSIDEHFSSVYYFSKFCSRSSQDFLILLSAKIKKTLLTGVFEQNSILIRVRQKKLLCSCLNNLKIALNSFRESTGLEIVAYFIGLARHDMDSLFGFLSFEDVLDKIFSQFCIGK